MGEQQAIDLVDEPNTVSSLTANLRKLGVNAGDTLLVHSSLGSLGWTAGGPQAVVEALRNVVTETGTVVMPTHSPQYTDPANWSNPPVPESWVDPIRNSMPPYRPSVTPTRGMGAIPECFRTYPDVVRGEHPTFSFAAWGAEAEAIVTDHPYDFGLGNRSPLGRIYERDGRVLLLGVGHETNTSLHLGEHRSDLDLEVLLTSAPVVEDGERVFVEYEVLETNSDDFPDLGAEFEATVGLTEGTVGAATAKLADQRPLVDFAVDWLEANRAE